MYKILFSRINSRINRISRCERYLGTFVEVSDERGKNWEPVRERFVPTTIFLFRFAGGLRDCDLKPAMGIIRQTTRYSADRRRDLDKNSRKLFSLKSAPRCKSWNGVESLPSVIQNFFFMFVNHGDDRRSLSDCPLSANDRGLLLVCD